MTAIAGPASAVHGSTWIEYRDATSEHNEVEIVVRGGRVDDSPEWIATIDDVRPVRGGAGCLHPDDDDLYGNSGRDEIRGGPGNDRISGGPGADRLYGNSGNDTVSGDAGKDFVSGGPGRDVVRS